MLNCENVPGTHGFRSISTDELLIILSIQALNIDPIPDPIPTAESPLEAN